MDSKKNSPQEEPFEERIITVAKLMSKLVDLSSSRGSGCGLVIIWAEAK